MTARALRRIEADMTALVLEPATATPEAIALLARRIGAQAEMLEQGIEG